MAEFSKFIGKQYGENPEIAAPYYKTAANLLTFVKQSMAFQGLQQLKLSRQLPDGTVIVAQSVYGNDKIFIHSPPPQVSPPISVPEIIVPEITENPKVGTWLLLYDKDGTVQELFLTDSEIAALITGPAETAAAINSLYSKPAATADIPISATVEQIILSLTQTSSMSKRFKYRGKTVYYVRFPFLNLGETVSAGFSAGTEAEPFCHGILIPDTGVFLKLDYKWGLGALPAVGQYVYVEGYDESNNWIVGAYEIDFDAKPPALVEIMTRTTAGEMDIIHTTLITSDGILYGNKLGYAEAGPYNTGLIYLVSQDIMSGEETLIYTGRLYGLVPDEYWDLELFRYYYALDKKDDYGFYSLDYNFQWNAWTVGELPHEGASDPYIATDVYTTFYKIDGTVLIEHTQTVVQTIQLEALPPYTAHVELIVTKTNYAVPGYAGPLPQEANRAINVLEFYEYYRHATIGGVVVDDTGTGFHPTVLSYHLDDVVYECEQTAEESSAVLRETYCRNDNIIIKAYLVTKYDATPSPIDNTLLLSFNAEDFSDNLLENLGITPEKFLGIYCLS
jgi:hypothetical protein